MRICLVSAAYRPYLSGVGEHVYNLARQLAARGHEVRLLTARYSPPGPQPDPPLVSRMGTTLIVRWRTGHFTLPVGWNLSRAVKRFISERSFDIVHCHGVFPPEIAYWATIHARVPVVTTFHWSFVPPSMFRLPLRLAFAGINDRIAARIAVSAACRDWVSPLFPGEYDVINNGVDTQHFRPDAQPPSSIAPLRRSILYVGRLDGRKGLPALLKAMPGVLREVPEVRLLVVGAGPLERHCRAMCRRMNISESVTFAGPVEPDYLPGYYAGSTIYVSPAVGRESMGIVLIEAMACGRAVIASDIPGYNEVIQQDRNGLLVPESDHAALAAAIVRLLKDEHLRRRIETGALERAADFAWPRITDQIESVYQRVLHRGR